MGPVADHDKYKDLDLDFIPHPVSGDVVQKIGVDAVKRSVKNLIYLRAYEKPFQPHIYSNIRALLFEPSTPLIKIQLKKSIIAVLKENEPRINLASVRIGVSPDSYTYNISINYTIINRPETQTVSIQLERLR
jgi:phage baseplate assembly protein W